MKRTRANAGFTLIELLVTVMILVILVIGIGVGMDTGSKIYQEAVFEADSATLAGILNTNLGDILRYSENIRVNTSTFEDSEGNYLNKSDVEFVFTSLDYGVQDAYFYTPVLAGGVSQGVIQLKSLKNDKELDLVNTGAYPGLVVYDFEIDYVPVGYNSDGYSGRGGYFSISYIISSESNDSLTRDVECVVRMMNPED